MSFFSWNIWGLGNPHSVKVLSNLVWLKQPKIIFLMETKVDSNKIEHIRESLGFEGSCIIDSYGNKGGLIML